MLCRSSWGWSSWWGWLPLLSIFVCGSALALACVCRKVLLIPVVRKGTTISPLFSCSLCGIQWFTCIRVLCIHVLLSECTCEVINVNGMLYCFFEGVGSMCSNVQLQIRAQAPYKPLSIMCTRSRARTVASRSAYSATVSFSPWHMASYFCSKDSLLSLNLLINACLN